MDSWLIKLRRDSDWWQDTLTVTDEAGAPVSFSAVSLVLEPDGVPLVTWQLGSEIIMPSPGVINFLVPKATIQAYRWSAASYRLSVVYSDGRIDGSFITGLAKVE